MQEFCTAIKQFIKDIFCIILFNVPNIVALITLHAHTGKYKYGCACVLTSKHAGFYAAQAAFYHSGLNFFQFLQSKNRPIEKY